MNISREKLKQKICEAIDNSDDMWVEYNYSCWWDDDGTNHIVLTDWEIQFNAGLPKNYPASAHVYSDQIHIK